MSKGILCVIAARQGSKGLPKKNIKNLAAHWMISYGYCQLVKFLQKMIKNSKKYILVYLKAY